jgi:hypothetical protein
VDLILINIYNKLNMKNKLKLLNELNAYYNVININSEDVLLVYYKINEILKNINDYLKVFKYNDIIGKMILYQNYIKTMLKDEFINEINIGIDSLIDDQYYISIKNMEEILE